MKKAKLIGGGAAGLLGTVFFPNSVEAAEREGATSQRKAVMAARDLAELPPVHGAIFADIVNDLEKVSERRIEEGRKRDLLENAELDSSLETGADKQNDFCDTWETETCKLWEGFVY